MQLKPGYEEEYKKRHDQIWPDLLRLLNEAGITEYRIYLDDETGSLFAIQKLNGNEKTDQLASHPVMQKWWDYMKDIMEVNSDNSPVAIPLREMFNVNEPDNE